MAKNKQSGLGRGIEALFEENDFNEINDNETVQDVKLSLIRPNPYQPRRTFDQKALRELASSIQESGVFQPIILRQPDPKLKRYELIAGERRFRASKLAMSDEKMMEVAVLENLQREDLTPLEEAQAYQTLMDKLSLTQAQVAERLGKSRPYIANYLRLLGLPNEIKELVSAGKLSMGQARTLLGLKDRKQLVKLAKQAVEKNLTVRQLEELVAQMNGTAEKKRAKRRQRKPAYVREAESQLQSKFGTKVAVAPSRKKNAGKIEIPYTSADDFNRILEVLNISLD